MGDFLELLEGFSESRDVQDLAKYDLSAEVLDEEETNEPESCVATRDRCTQFHMNESKTVWSHRPYR